ncbi:MAG: hypothetical protein ACI9SB_001145 [Candidatus Azotimanducaceae bacterium]|jgi:hypothetical protein
MFEGGKWVELSGAWFVSTLQPSYESSCRPDDGEIRQRGVVEFDKNQ